MYEGFKNRQEGTEPPVTEEEPTELSPEQIRIQELENLVKKLTEAETKPKETDMEESVEIDKEKFAKLLGRDKARGQDIADMLLSFSSKALAPEADVKSAFAEFAADEVKRPSRLQKIEDNAAALAINKYIKGEISKAEMEKMVQLNRIKIADQIELSKAATSLDMALQEAVKSGVGSSKKSIAVIQSAVDRILGDKYDFGGPLPEGEGAAEKISEGVIYVRDSASVKGAKELITIDPSTGTLTVIKTIF